MTDLASDGAAQADEPVEPQSDGPAQAQVDVLVVGAGIGGLVMGRALASRGYDVVVVDAATAPGGPARSVHVPGVGRVDAGATHLACRDESVAAIVRTFAEELALDLTSPESLARGDTGLATPDGIVPLPELGPLGIPLSPLASDVAAAIGGRGAMRAYLDRVLPFLKIGTDTTLGPLVTRRMGHLVLNRLVAPILGGQYGADAATLDVDAIAPGLNQAITRAGTLSGGASVYVDRAERPSVRLAGGPGVLVDALVAEIEHWRGAVWQQARVSALAVDDDEWLVSLDARAEHLPTEVRASAVVLAAGASTGAALIATLDGAAPFAGGWQPAEPVDIVLAGADAVAAERTACLVTHDLQADLDSASIIAGNGERAALLRAVSGRGRPSALRDATPDDARDRALAAASTLLGAPALAQAPAAADAVVVRHELEAPHTALGDKDRLAALAAWCDDGGHPPLALAGAWVAGTRLGDIVAHALDAQLGIRKERFARERPSWPEREAQRSAAAPDDSDPDHSDPAHEVEGPAGADPGAEGDLTV